MAQRDCRVRVIHKENGGLVSAWKRGVKESTGDYLCFVDSDDWVDTNMIEEMAACLSGNPREIIASDYVIERQQEICLAAITARGVWPEGDGGGSDPQPAGQGIQVCGHIPLYEIDCPGAD